VGAEMCIRDRLLDYPLRSEDAFPKGLRKRGLEGVEGL